MVTVRTKFQVSRVSSVVNGAEVELAVVSGNSEDNKEFFKYTPSGSIKLGLVKPEHAERFKPGAEFYVDFTPVN